MVYWWNTLESYVVFVVILLLMVTKILLARGGSILCLVLTRNLCMHSAVFLVQCVADCFVMKCVAK